MKRFFILAAIIAFVFGFTACAKAPKVQAPLPPPPPPPVQAPPPPPEYRKAAIELFLKTDPKLNLYRDTSHTLVLCIYELKDPNAFNQLIDEPDGLTKLLECGRFDGSVAYAKKLVLLPGRELREIIDQAEGAKYLGLVGGYFEPGKIKPYRLYPITTTAGGSPASMKVELYLGPRAIQDTDAQVPVQDLKEQNSDIPSKLSALKQIEDGYTAIRLQRYDEAQAFFKKAIEIDPEDADAYAGMSIALFHAKQHSRAYEMADAALQKDPRSYNGHYAMALILYRVKKYNKALESIDRAIELHPHSPANYFNHRGETHIAIGKSKSAIQDFEQACKMEDPQACRRADKLKQQLKRGKRK